MLTVTVLCLLIAVLVNKAVRVAVPRLRVMRTTPSYAPRHARVSAHSYAKRTRTYGNYFYVVRYA